MGDGSESPRSPFLQAELEENFGLLHSSSSASLAAAGAAAPGGRLLKPKITASTSPAAASGLRRALKVGAGWRASERAERNTGWRREEGRARGRRRGGREREAAMWSECRSQCSQYREEEGEERKRERKG